MPLLLESVGFVVSTSHDDSYADESERYTFFWRSESPLSQWYGCRFTVDGTEYNCAEQYMMQQKACECAFFNAVFLPVVYLRITDIKTVKLGFYTTQLSENAFSDKVCANQCKRREVIKTCS